MTAARPDAAVPEERLRGVAGPWLTVRVAEGLAGWLLFNEFFLPYTVSPWLSQTSFVLSLLVNLLFALLYLRGRGGTRIFAADAAASAILLAIPAAQSGGVASPLLLLVPVKTAAYAVALSPRQALLFFLCGTSMGASLAVLDASGVLPMFHLEALAPGAATRVYEVAVVAVLAGAAPAIGWLWHVRQAGSGQDWSGGLERDGGDALVAGALLRVSEAVNLLTRIDEILEKVVEIALGSVQVDSCVVSLWSEEVRTYTGAAAAGAARGRSPGAAVLSPEEAPDFEWVRRLGHCAVVPVAETEAGGGAALLIAPMSSGDRFYGVMEFVRRGTARPFTQRDLKIADGIARQTAVALERARLVQDARRLALGLDSSEEAILITDAGRRVVFANPAFARMFGYRAEEVIGTDAAELAGNGQDWVRGLRETLREHGWRGETVGFRKDGTPVWVTVNTNLIQDDKGRMQGAVAVVEDVSEQRRLRAQAERSERFAALGQMAAGMAHEINNALSVILAQVRDGAGRNEAELRDILGRVEGQARRIGEIVRSTLGLARPPAPRVEPTDLPAAVERTLELIRPERIELGVDAQTEFETRLPPAGVEPRLLEQVLLNLFRNALQAMARADRKRLRVEVRATGKQLAVVVSDTGPGIPPAVLPRIFDPFFSTRAGGSGLGLSICYNVARAHGGDLQVSSAPGAGATFTLLLPVAEPRRPSTLECALLVDDDPQVAEAIGAMLVREGLRVRHVPSAGEALDVLAAEPWGAILLDVRLPDLSGPELYAEIERRRPELARRVAFVTGGLWRAESRRRLDLPPQPTLAKPCTQEELRAVLLELESLSPQAA